MTEKELRAKVMQWGDGPKDAERWWHEHRSPSLGHKTCAELVKEGNIQAVESYIIAVEYGTYV